MRVTSRETIVRDLFFKSIRPSLFWVHLIVGAVAGLVILVMSLTGALLAFQPQIIAFVDRDVRTVAVPEGHTPLAPRALLEAVTTARPDLHPTSITVSSDAAASVTVAAGRQKATHSAGSAPGDP